LFALTQNFRAESVVLAPEAVEAYGEIGEKRRLMLKNIYQAHLDTEFCARFSVRDPKA